jgi:hypothetical protein
MTRERSVRPDDEDFQATTADPMNQGKSDAEIYRLALAQKMLRLFKKAHGRPARTMEELEAWVAKGDLFGGHPR